MGDVHGRGPVVRAHDDLFGAFDDRHVTIRRVWRTPREQTVEWTMTGIQARDYMRVAATHKSVAFTGLTLLWTQDDGRITEVHVYVDVALVMGQLGVGAKPLLALPPPSASTAPAQAFEQSLPPSAAEQKNVALVRSWLDALENRHEAEFVDATDSDVEVSTLERPQAAHGADAIRTYYATMHRAVGQLDTTVSNAWGVENFAIVEYFIAGEQLGPIGWIAAQRDKVIRLELVDVIEMREGKSRACGDTTTPSRSWSAPLRKAASPDRAKRRPPYACAAGPFMARAKLSLSLAFSMAVSGVISFARTSRSKAMSRVCIP